jgi:hypothetical protein
MWAGFMWYKIWINGGLFENGNEFLGSIKAEEHLD